MGMIRPIFRNEPTLCSGPNNTLLQLPKLPGHPDTGPEDSSPIEDARAFKQDGHLRRLNFPKAPDYALACFSRALPEELQSNMPRFRRTPAQTVARDPEIALQAIERLDHRRRQRNRN